MSCVYIGSWEEYITVLAQEEADRSLGPFEGTRMLLGKHFFKYCRSLEVAGDLQASYTVVIKGILLRKRELTRLLSIMETVDPLLNRIIVVFFVLCRYRS